MLSTVEKTLMHSGVKMKRDLPHNSVHRFSVRDFGCTAKQFNHQGTTVVLAVLMLQHHGPVGGLLLEPAGWLLWYSDYPFL